MFLTFDIGGTHLRGGKFCPKTKKLLSEQRTLSPNYLKESNATIAFEKLCKELQNLGNMLFPKEPPKGIVMGFPSPIKDDGTILAAPTLFGSTLPAHDIHNLLAKTFCQSIPFSIINDVTAAGYRYAEQNKENFCIITVSSGIGNKIFINGTHVVGENGFGGEIGHLQVDHSQNAPICDCGGAGHLGALASGRGTLALAKRMATENPNDFRLSVLKDMLKNNHIDTLDTNLLVRAFHENDAWTIKLIRKSASFLGRCIALIHLSLGIEDFVIIGGFAKALGTSYTKTLAEFAKNAAWNLGQDWEKIIRLGHQDDYDGLIGAGCYASRHINQC